jgi:hypothetical protein
LMLTYPSRHGLPIQVVMAGHPRRHGLPIHVVMACLVQAISRRAGDVTYWNYSIIYAAER